MNLLFKDKQFGSREKDFIKLIDYFREKNTIDKDFLSTYTLLRDSYTLHLLYTILEEVGENFCFCTYCLLQDLRTIDENIQKLQRNTENYERARKITSDINTLKKAQNIFLQYSSNSENFIKELDEAINELESLELKAKNIQYEHKGERINVQLTSFLTTGNPIFDKRLDYLKPHPNIFFNVINQGLETFKRSMKLSDAKYNVRALDSLHELLKELYSLN